MTKQILIPSVLLMAAGCSTQSSDFADYGLGELNAQAMGEESLPGPHGEVLDAMVEQIVNAASAVKSQNALLSKVYAEPVESNEEGLPLSGTCGINPEIQSIQVLDSDCRDINLRWGWEVEVENCEIDGEVYDGLLQLSYDELQNIPAFLPIDMVISEALQALNANQAGFASARYALNLESDDFALDACGQELGPADFRFSETKTHRFSFSDGQLESMHNNGVGHEMSSPILEGGMHTVANGDGVHEITLEDGDRNRSLVSYRVLGATTLAADQWPNAGRIEAHVEGVGDVTLVFTAQTPIDGSVDVFTPFTAERVNLPME
jgi:hypothetical protein